MRALTLLMTLSTLATGCAEPGLSTPPAYGDTATDTAVIWNGFRHDWGYNHRLNRLGNWVGPVSCDGGDCSVELAHAAASGLGTDTATWSSRATALRAPGTGFLPGVTSLTFAEDNAEGSRLERTERVTLPLTGLLAGREGYNVLLQGYDIMALEDADMFVGMAIDLGPVEVDAVAGELSFDVTMSVELDCDRLECDGTWHLGGKLDTDVDYGAHIMWLVVGADAPDGGVACTSQGGSYDWTDEAITDELTLEDATFYGTVARTGRPMGTGDAVLALQSLSLQLSHDSHLVSWATGVRPGAFDPKSGVAEYALEVFFKQWSAVTWERANSYTTDGTAWADGTVCLVTLPHAEAVELSAAGSLFWKANGDAGTDDRAVDRVATAMPFAPTTTTTPVAPPSSAVTTFSAAE